MGTVKRIVAASLAVVLASAAPYAAATSKPKTGAQATPVDASGKPGGPSIPLPDCRSCKVKQIGPNEYEIKIPPAVRQKLGMPSGR